MDQILLVFDWICSTGKLANSWVSLVKRFSSRDTSKKALSTVCILADLKSSVRSLTRPVIISNYGATHTWDPVYHCDHYTPP